MGIAQTTLEVFNHGHLEKGKLVVRDVYSLPTELKLAKIRAVHKPVRVLKTIEDLMERRKEEVRERLMSYRKD